MYTYTLVPVSALTLLDNVTCIDSVHKNPVVLTKQLYSVHTRTFLRVWRNLTEVLVARTFCISVCCIFRRKSNDTFRLGLPKNLHRSLFLVLLKKHAPSFYYYEVKRVKHKLCLLIFYRQCTALKLLCLKDLLAVIWCVLLNCRLNDARRKLAWCFVSSRVERPKSCDLKRRTFIASFCFQWAALVSCKWIKKRGLVIKAVFLLLLDQLLWRGRVFTTSFLGSWNGGKKSYVYENVHKVAGNEWMLFAW